MNMNSCSCGTTERDVVTLELSKLLRLVGDETRLQLLTILVGEGSHCVCDFGGHMEGTSQSLLSHHLADLRDAGLVQTTKQGLRGYTTSLRSMVDVSWVSSGS
ncbi:MAG: metalloregulator ArsR/SmtB family transcription factor [Candidatus Saccharimonadales bacterium]